MPRTNGAQRNLTATLGLRVDRNDVTGNELSPRAALIWKATPDTTVKALYGRAHRAPNAFERDYDDRACPRLPTRTSTARPSIPWNW